MEPFITLNIPVPMPGGIVMRLVRFWDPMTNQWRNRMGPVCECGQIIPYFVQIDPWTAPTEYCECCGHEL